MKKIFFLVCLLLTIYAFGQAGKSESVSGKNVSSDVPATLLTDDSTYWTTSILSALDYVKKPAETEYANYKNAGGMVAKFKFKKGNRFEFLSYLQANSYGTETETWTKVEGTVVFTKDDKGQNVFITKADKGVYRIAKDGRITTKTIRQKELEAPYSNTYLWERINFPDDLAHTYLLTVNLDEHPQANVKVSGSIDRSWVSKFHAPIKK